VDVPLPTLEVLERARRGEAADSADIAALVNAWSVGAASDAQMAAWCATAGLGDMSYDASLALVRTLLVSGDRLELQSLGPVVDIRSTGGVGESALVIAASCIAAASGAIVASTGASSIAHVGGVLDAVSAATGAVAEMPVEQWVTQARDVGMVIAEPGDRLVPDERRLMSLRESTATAGSDVLVAVSAASRAISGGAGVMAVSVPAGQAGLLPALDDAQAVAGLIERLGAEWNRTVVTVPAMRDEPVAGVAGHALEVREALAVLRGEGDAALADSAAALAAAALGAAGLDGDVASARATLGDGRAAAMAGRWIAAQGGDATVVDHPESLPQALLLHTVEAASSGQVTHVDGGIVGSAARWLGAGRLDPGQVIDPSVGVEVVARPGTPVAAGDVLAVVHASDAWMAARALEMLQGAFRVAA
jgi:pyrimidine-nucleoside phosphorylase